MDQVQSFRLVDSAGRGIAYRRVCIGDHFRPLFDRKMAKEIIFIVALIIAYGIAEVRHDFSVSKDSRGGKWNRRWHRWDALFHLGMAIAVWAVSDVWHGLMVPVTRAVFFDTIFSAWKGDALYVGEREPKWKRRLILWYRMAALALFFGLIYIIFL